MDTKEVLPFFPKYLICVDKYKAHKIEGKLYCGYRLFDGEKFSDVSDLLLILEKIMTAIQSPQEAHQKRTFEKGEKSQTLDRGKKREVLRTMRGFNTNS